MAFHLYRKATEVAWVGLQDGWGGVSGNHPGGMKSVCQADGDSDLLPDCAYSRESSEKEQWPLPTLVSGIKLSPSPPSDARRFIPAPTLVSGAFQSAVPAVELRGS